MNVKELVQGTLEISTTGVYEVDGKRTEIPDIARAAEVKVFDDESVRARVEAARKKIACSDGKIAEIVVNDKDTFVSAQEDCAGRTIVLNFANAYQPGGGFLYYMTAQEETLCRRSTLFQSLNSDEARKMYDHNKAHRGAANSDYLLVSPYTVVFRKEDFETMPPFYTSVITSAAPDVIREERLLNDEELKILFERKIENVLAVSATEGYDSIVLGAWGCGAFGNNSKDVAGYFYDILVEKGYAKLFKNVVFAVYVSKTRGRNTYNFNQFNDRFKK